MLDDIKTCLPGLSNIKHSVARENGIQLDQKVADPSEESSSRRRKREPHIVRRYVLCPIPLLIPVAEYSGIRVVCIRREIPGVRRCRVPVEVKLNKMISSTEGKLDLYISRQ